MVLLSYSLTTRNILHIHQLSNLQICRYMMRIFWTIVFIIFTNLIQGQKLIDVIGDHNIDSYQEFTLSNTTGLSFFDFDEDGWDDLTYPMHNDSM